jgi:hypothetical protein
LQLAHNFSGVAWSNALMSPWAPCEDEPALQGRHDVGGAGHEIMSVNPPRKVDAPSEECLDFFNNLGRRTSCFGAQHPSQIHASAPLDFAAEH